MIIATTNKKQNNNNNNRPPHPHKPNYDNMYFCDHYQLGSTIASHCPLINNFKPICTVKMCNEACKTNYKECYKYLGIKEKT